MRITLKDVAKRAGVSTSAVSRTFTEHASVSQTTRKRVMRAADELGYRPNVLAGSLKTRRTKLIGLVADNLRNPVLLLVIDRFTSLIQEKGFRPLLVNLGADTDPESSVRMLKQYSVDGVIVASSTLSTSFAVAFHNAGLPVVHCFGRYSGESHAHVVSIDNEHCGGMAARALLDHGYKRVAFMGGPAEATSTQDRLRGFETAALRNSMKISSTFAGAYSYQAGCEEMSRLIATGDLAQAYFCGDDILAIGAMDALVEAGIRVPEDVGIIGLDDAEMASWGCIQLTTIAQPVAEIISASVDLIVSLIQTPDTIPETRLWPCQIKYRRTLRHV